MSAENKAVVRRMVEAFNRGNLGLADELLSGSYVWHGPGGTDARGPEGFKQVASMYRAAFPDASLTIEDIIAEGDKVVIRWTARGTHQGELMGVAPSGRRVTVPGITISQVVDGKIVEEWETFDQLGMFQAIGTVPSSAAHTA